MSLTRRRLLFGALACSSAPLLLRARAAVAAPTDRVVRVGVLFSGSPWRWELIDRALIAGLSEHGYIEGRNIAITRRAGTYPDDRMEGYASELAGMKLDAIYTSCGWTAAAASKATSQTPIIFGKVSDPVARGLVKSLAKPGTNLTGRTGRVPQLAPKMLELLHQTLPNAKHVGVLMDGRSKAVQVRFAEADTAARAMHLRLSAIDLHRIQTVDAAVSTLRAAEVSALLTLPDDDLVAEFLDQIHQATVLLRLPIIYPSRELVEFGVMSYGSDSYDIYRRSVVHLDRVIKGANPAELPIEQPNSIDLAINLKRANALGITLPRATLMRADYVVR